MTETFNEPPNQPTGSTPTGVTKEERTWAMACHLSALALFVGVPFGNIIGPLIVWMIKKDEMPLVDDQGKESLNFQISTTLYAAVAAILVLVLIGIPLLIGLAIFDLVMLIMAAIKANEGIAYRYPLTIRLLK